MRIILVDKKEEPPFRFYVKENNSRYDYYAYEVNYPPLNLKD